MLLNIAFDFVLGLIPLLGDLVDAVYRANTRNAMLLEDHLREKGAKTLRQTGQPVPTVDPSNPVEFDRQEEALASAPHSQPEAIAAAPNETTPTAPAPAQAKEGRGWRSKSRPQDVEMGEVGNSSRAPSKSKRTVR